MPSSTEKAIHSIVLDAGPLLLNEPSISTLLAKAEQIFTTPSVLAEIKDENARNRLETTVKPFLTLRTPTPTSLKAVSDFARKTGDLAVLSKTDLQVFALAYEVECERNLGDWRLRSTPGQKKLNGSPPQALKKTPDEPVAKDKEADSTIANDEGKEETLQTVEEPSTNDADGNNAPESQEAKSPDEDTPATSESPPTHEEPPHSELVHQMAASSLEESSQVETETTEISGEASDSDSDGWITPSNLKKHQQRDQQAIGIDRSQPVTLQVATVTTDFALQNSLLLMNLNLLSSSLSRITQLKSHILRCHACFATCKEMTKQFCPRCGGPTLTRVSCSTTSTGGFQLHLKKNMQWNNRGNRYSVPKPAGGTSSGKLGKGGRGQGGKNGWGKELILAEDQKEYVKAVTEQNRRKEKDLMDDDFLPSILTGDRSTNGKIRIGAGRNVNSRKN